MNPLQDKTNFEKGESLERAVEAIEHAVFKYEPSLKNVEYTITRRKIVFFEGANHEIDLHLEFHLAEHHNAVFIFECRNRREKVDKNDVVILDEKAIACGAQKAFLVARSFTKGAEQKSENPRSRVVLLKAKNLLEGDAEFKLPSIKQTSHSDVKMEIALIYDDGMADEGDITSDLPEELTRDLVKCAEVVLAEDIKQQQKAGVSGHVQRTCSHIAPLGPLTFRGRKVVQIGFKISYTFVSVEIPFKLEARFDIDGLGKYLEMSFDHPQRGPLIVCISAKQ